MATATTDLAAIRYRVSELHADRMVYVTDARQAQHFAMVFDAAAERAGWLAEARAEHVPFGAMLGEDGSRSRPAPAARSGSPTCSTTQSRGPARWSTREPDFSDAERAAIAQAVGIGAVKYADLSTSRQRDLVFSFDRMLALDGNTAPYLLYAHVRAAAIAARAGETSGRGHALAEPAERALALKLAALRRRARGRRGHARAAPAVHLPLRARRRVHGLLRGDARCSKAATPSSAAPGSRCAR